MNSVKREIVMSMVATMCAGAFANPIFGTMLTNQYEKQTFIQQMIFDTQMAIQNSGIDIIDSDIP